MSLQENGEIENPTEQVGKETENPTNNTVEKVTNDLSKSALQDNIDNKGKNAYYFAHANKPTGPKWDGKPEPRLLGRQASSTLGQSHQSSFDVHKSNITSYAFSDEGAQIKLYVELPEVGTKCTDKDDVKLDYTKRSLCLSVENYQETTRYLGFGRLSGAIDSATYKIKTNRIIVTLVKVDPEVEWNTINDKGSDNSGSMDFLESEELV